MAAVTQQRLKLVDMMGSGDDQEIAQAAPPSISASSLG